MQYQQLSRSALRVSRIGFGCWPIGGHGWGQVDDRQSIDAVRAALDHGINFFDTADVYGLGHSERILAQALGARRRDVVIATKFGVRWDDTGRTWRDASLAWLDRALHGSLQRLRLDTIPLYQIHWADGVTPLDQLVERLLRYRDEGKIGAIGFCNAGTDEVARVADSLACVQTAYNAVDRAAAAALLPACAAAGVSAVTHTSIAQGLCSGKYGPAETFGADDVRSRSAYFGGAFRAHMSTVARIHAVGMRHGRTATQTAIGWVLADARVAAALVGMKTAAQVHENVAPLWTLSAAEREFIASGTFAPAAATAAAHAL